jgi:hypothetical protein
VTRRSFAAAVACAALAAPAGAHAQDATTSVPTTTIQPGAATTITPGATTTAPGATTITPGATTTAPGATTTAPPATTTPPPVAQPAAPVTAAPAATPSDGRDTAAILLLLVVVVLLLAALALAGVARWQAWDPPWLQRWRHASAEAGWRASNAWAEFSDWLRLGR